MKVRISKTMKLPMLYGILAAWIIVGTLPIVLFLQGGSLPVVNVLLAVSGLILFAVTPVLRRAAWVYTNARKYHQAEYKYELGNGAEVAKAAEYYEGKVKKAISVWMKRHLMRNSLGIAPMSFFILLFTGQGFFYSLLGAIGVLVMIALAVAVGMWVMLFSARKLCYDKFGNIKND